MACISFAFKALCFCLFFIVVASRSTVRPKVFNVQRHGAKPDGKTDNANAFTSIWSRACKRISGSSKIYVPKGTFYLGGVEFVGPCKNPIEFIIDGTLLAPANPSDIKQDTWINFRYINNLSISGSGTLDGQGKQSWPHNDCHTNPNCPKLAMTMGFAFVNNSNIKDITSLNSKMGHFNFFSVHHFNITGVTITAPGDSPNTDGIKMGSCSNIKISDTNIGTGDDCIAILSGTTNLNISNVNCGPGHGISVGSLGKNKDEKDVKDLIVRDVIFNGTSDGIRIKTWESSASKILVSNFVYENIQMIDVGKPINIDQKYCPHPPCEHERKAFTSIWSRACKRISGSSKIYVPKGTFYLGGVEFVGLCKNPIEFIIDGTLLAPANPSDIKQDTCINFRYINNLSISGSGTLDGQGKQSWPLNDCHKNPNCPKLGMGESHVQIQNLKLKNIYGTSKNKVAVNLQCSKIFPCKNVELIDINIKQNGVKDGSSTSVCENVDGFARGKMFPQHCLN
ncbi:putative glycosidase [Arabidopsis thaliana]